MAEGLLPVLANSCLDNEVSAYPWVKMHVDPPGAAGTSNPATETTRKQVTWGTAASGEMANTNELEWTSVAGTEDYTHFSALTASTAGTAGFTGGVTANPVTAGDTFTIPIGELTASFTLAS